MSVDLRLPDQGGRSCPDHVSCLQVTVRDTLLAARAAPLFRTIQRLPVLLDLDVNYEGRFRGLYTAASAGDGLPRCEELAELHSRTLTRLRVSMLDGQEDGDLLRLSALPELRSCELLGSEHLGGHIVIDAATFCGAPQLKNLCTDTLWELDLQDGSLAHLGALTSLALINCGLLKVPADVAPLRHTLCELDLSDNEHLQIDDAAMACIVQCSRLSMLSICKPDIYAWAGYFYENWESVVRHMHGLHYAPSLWSSESVRYLVQLPSAFRTQHGRDLRFHC